MIRRDNRHHDRFNDWTLERVDKWQLERVDDWALERVDDWRQHRHYDWNRFLRQEPAPGRRLAQHEDNGLY